MVNKGIDDKLAAETDPEKTLEEIENNSISLLEFLNPDHRTEIIRGISLISDSIEKELLTKHYAKKIGINHTTLKKAVRERSEGSEGNFEGVREKFSAHFDQLIDLVSHEGETQFLIMAGSSLLIVNQAQVEESFISKPPAAVPWTLPTGQKVVDHYNKLIKDVPHFLQAIYEDLLLYYKSIAELPSEAYYHLLTAWTIHTYLIDKFQYSPILCFYAVPERGKSRTGKAVIYVSYRGLHVISLREAYILRACHDLHATLFFDVMDLWEKAEKNNTEDI